MPGYKTPTNHHQDDDRSVQLYEFILSEKPGWVSWSAT